MGNNNCPQSLGEMKLLATMVGGLGMLTAFGHFFPMWGNALVAGLLGAATARLQFMIDPSNYVKMLDRVPTNREVVVNAEEGDKNE